MTKRKEEKDKVYKKNLIECKSCGLIFHRCKSMIKSKNNFCSIDCKSKGMSEGLTKPMRLGTGNYDKITPLIRKKYYKYKRFDKDRFKSDLDYTIDYFIDLIKNGECAYCGYKEELGLDRIDNKQGHRLNNVVVCCHLCNMSRGDRFTYDEMLCLGKEIKKIKDKRNEEKEQKGTTNVRQQHREPKKITR